jgi:hypothetical protein
LKFWNRRKKRIRELEEEVEWLNEDIQLHKYCLLGLATRLSNIEHMVVSLGFASYKEKEEVLLN